MRHRDESGRELVIVGEGEFAEIAYEYFTHDSPHRVAAFAAEREYISRASLYDLPVVPLDELTSRFPPVAHAAFVAVTYTKLNRVRTRLLAAIRGLGYEPISYVSSHAFVWHNVRLGANCFVFEGNVLQHHVEIGDNVVLWSGNHVGHRTKVGANCFISSQVVISGYCAIGESCFFGVNSAIGDHVNVGRDCVVGAGAVITRDTEPGRIYKGHREGPAGSSYERFGIEPP